MQMMLQTTICDGLAFDPFAFEEDGLGPSEVDVGGRREGFDGDVRFALAGESICPATWNARSRPSSRTTTTDTVTRASPISPRPTSTSGAPDHPPRTRKDQTTDDRKSPLAAPRAGFLTDGPAPPFVGDANFLKNSDDGQTFPSFSPSLFLFVLIQPTCRRMIDLARVDRQHRASARGGEQRNQRTLILGEFLMIWAEAYMEIDPRRSRSVVGSPSTRR